jgi:hypothetical protein
MAVVSLSLWLFVTTGKNDLLLATRSLMGQAKKATFATQSSFYSRYRLPEGNPDRQEVLFQRLWAIFQDCQPQRADYGDRHRLKADDGRYHEHRQVIVTGRSLARGEPVTLRVEWVKQGGNWYIHDYSSE